MNILRWKSYAKLSAVWIIFSLCCDNACGRPRHYHHEKSRLAFATMRRTHNMERTRNIRRDQLNNQRIQSEMIYSTTVGRRSPLSSIPTSSSLSRTRRRFLSSSIIWSKASDGGDDDDEETEQQQLRRRDKLMDWLYSGGSSSNKAMVKPINVEDGSVMETDDEPKRVKTNFDGLFQGMPGVNDILGGDEIEDGEQEKLGKEEESKSRKTKKDSNVVDDSWFDEEKKRIENDYRKILENALEQISQQRRDNPDNVPEGSEGIMESVVKQELEQEIAATREQRLQERLQEMRQRQMKDVEEQDLSNLQIDDNVQQMIDKTNIEDDRLETEENKIEDFQKYEQDAIMKARKAAEAEEETSSPLAGNMSPPNEQDALDEWTLNILEDMAKRKEDNEDSLSIVDNLEENIDDLKKQIQKEKEESGKVKPETMKEWQMYRLIATRLKNELGEGSDDKENEVDEEAVKAQLQSWKDFQKKEEDYRRKFGLSEGIKMPFEWQKAGRNPLEEMKAPELVKEDNRSPSEVRKELNQLALKAMEDLVKKGGTGTLRSSYIEQSFEDLKKSLDEGEDDMKDEVPKAPQKSSEPVDLSDVFNNNKNKNAAVLDDDEFIQQRQSPPPPQDTQSIPYFSKKEDIKNEADTLPAPPKTPFFSSDESLDTVQSPLSPPNTPFFALENDDENAKEVVADVVENDGDGSNEDKGPGQPQDYGSELGSYEDQRLRSMYQRAGARTESEKESLRIKWEEYQRVEEEQRRAAGISRDSDDSGDALLESRVAKGLGYDISDVLKDEGDVDAEKILQSIGPRPTATSGLNSSSTSSATGGVGAISKDNISVPDVDQMSPSQLAEYEAEAESKLKESTLDPEEVSEELYRAVSAVGGGRTRDDPVARAAEKADFLDFVRKEDELREKLVNTDKEALSQEAISGAMDKDSDTEEKESAESVEDAKKVLSSIGPRPEVPKTHLDERALSDMFRGGDYNTGDEEDDGGDNGDVDDEIINEIPDWLQKERKEANAGSSSTPLKRRRGGFLGMEEFEIEDDAEDVYEEQMRQAEEFARRRSSSGRKQMGIDISDVLGTSRRDYKYSSESAADDYYLSKGSGAGFSNFEYQKANLLEYTELDIRSLNLLMDQRDSVYTTGVSQYMKKLNKPFSEFGVIMRLEGVLVDITGIQLIAWSKVADHYGVETPAIEDIRRASVSPAELAVQKIFGWSDDFLFCREVARLHRNVLRDVFESWIKEQLITIPEEIESTPESKEIDRDNDMLARSDIRSSVTPRSEKELLEMQWQAWIKTAEQIGVQPPLFDEVLVASAINPDDAIRVAFPWSIDESKIADVVAMYRKQLEELMGVPSTSTLTSGENAFNENSSNTNVGDATQAGTSALSEDDAREIQFMAWSRTADQFTKEPPTPDQTMAALVINDPFVAVCDIFGWTNDSALADQIVDSYNNLVKQLTLEKSNSREGVLESQLPANTDEVIGTSENNSAAAKSGPVPTDKDMLDLQVAAWTATAQKHGFVTPPLETIKLAINLDPAASLDLFGLTKNGNTYKEILSTYEIELRNEWDKCVKKNNWKVDKTQIRSETPVESVESVSESSEETFKAAMDAWTNLAKERGYSPPTTEDVLYALTVGADDAIVSGFKWTSDPLEAKLIANAYTTEFEKSKAKKGRGFFSRRQSTPPPAPLVTDTDQVDRSPPFFTVAPGASRWLKSLIDVDMPVGIVSYLDRDMVDVFLEQGGLANLISPDKRVSANNAYSSDSDQLLGGALRVERRPDHCVVIDASPESSVAAHDVEMKCVSKIGAYPMFDLLASDTSARDFDDLTPMNLRRLFGERIADQPLADMQQIQPTTVRRIKTRFWEEGDRE